MANYTTTDLVEAYLGIEINSTSSPSESAIETYIGWVSDEIDHITKGKYSLTEVVEIIDLNSDTMATSANVSDSTSSLDLPYVYDIVKLNNTSVVRIKTLEFNSAGPSEVPVWVSKTIGWGGAGVLVNDSLNLINPSDMPRRGRCSVRVTYEYGKNVVPGFVEKLATRMVALEVMSGQQSQALTQGTGRIQIGDISIDDPGSFSSVFVKQTQEYVDNKLKELGGSSFYLV